MYVVYRQKTAYEMRISDWSSDVCSSDQHASDQHKPGPGLLFDLARRLGLNLETVPAIGDSLRYIKAARVAGARPVLVRTGNGRKTEGEHAAELHGGNVYDKIGRDSGRERRG